ncbi:response regulator [Blastopirellula marina]|uniref:Chemotaxis response regulator n=1 Tax=Blastopirellula marina DSM 3645 TaxID=314230 RepID=A3ZQH3_9BACT|nr:response regulator [Blastopirellula marina]EAQ81449.1 chemotaxis response regulator [Blastopirellula marina DSM 3645]
MSKRLLVTDDAMIIREMIKETAIAAGWEVVGEADNGLAALEAFRKWRPDAMTLDIVMPEYDGIYALENIRAEFPDARVLMVSAIDQTSVLKDALRKGATDFIIKPSIRCTEQSCVMPAVQAFLLRCEKEQGLPCPISDPCQCVECRDVRRVVEQWNDVLGKTVDGAMAEA